MLRQRHIMVKSLRTQRIRSVQTQVNLPALPRPHRSRSRHVTSILGQATEQTHRSAESVHTIYYDSVSTSSQLDTPEQQDLDDEDAYLDPEEPSPVHSLRSVSASAASLTTTRTMLGHETWYKIVRDICFPVLVVGFSLGTSGILFQRFRNAKDGAFHEIREFSVLVLPLFRLKNNLELVGISKLTMHLNLGGLKTKSEKFNYCIADACITQVHSIVAGFIAGVISVLIVYLHDATPALHTETIYIIMASSALTAATTALFFGILTMLMICILHNFHINPDNVGVPLTIAISDISTLVILYWTSCYLRDVQHTKKWLAPMIIGLLCVSVPLWAMLHYWYVGKWKPLYDCWIPFLTSMALSCTAGAIVDKEADKYPDIILYLELITGVTGVLVSVHYCRIMTSYHRFGKPGVIPTINNVEGRVCYNPIDVLFRLGIHSRGFWVFFLIGFPAQTLFSIFMFQIAPDHARDCFPSFLWMYILSCGLHILLLLWTTHFATNLLWKCKIDPSNYVIPFIHGLGDVLGTGLLSFICHMLARVQNCQMNEREAHDKGGEGKLHSSKHLSDHGHRTR